MPDVLIEAGHHPGGDLYFPHGYCIQQVQEGLGQIYALIVCLNYRREKHALLATKATLQLLKSQSNYGTV